MKINLAQNMLLLAGVALSAPQLEATTLPLYGTTQAEKATTSQYKANQYILHMGAFKSQQNATRYQEQLQKKTKRPVHLAHDKNSNVPYRVYLGPFDALNQIGDACQELLGNVIVAPLANVLPQTTATTTTKTKTTKTAKNTKNNTEKNALKHIFANGFPTLSPVENQSRSRVVTFNVGPAWSNPGKTQTIVLEPGVQYTFEKTNGTNTIGVGEIFVGFEHLLSPDYKGQLGVAFLGATNVNLTGDVLIDSDPNFNNMFYTYSINHLHFALKGKLLSDNDKKTLLSFYPYISGSVGVGYNQSYKFGYNARIYEQVIPPAFQSNTVTAFTYTAGAGLQRRISRDWILGLGYDFEDWGKSYLRPASGQTTNRGLALNHVYVNQLQFGFTFQPQITK